jgi:hypothetical protein
MSGLFCSLKHYPMFLYDVVSAGLYLPLDMTFLPVTVLGANNLQSTPGRGHATLQRQRFECAWV